MNILFIHQSFPGQFGNLAANLAANPRNRVVALAISQYPVPEGVQLRCYSLLRSAVPETHPLLRDQEAKVLRAEACAAAALQLKREGFVPDLIVAHPGWGEALFMKEIFPHTRLVIYCEYYYALEGQDVGFDPEMPAFTLEHRYQLRLRNSTNLLSMEIADAAISPTQWQRSTYPTWAQQRISVIHDGIDFSKLAHRPQAQLRLAANELRPELELKVGDEVLTFVARNLEPVRGFHVFMRALPQVLRDRPKAHVLIVGGDGVSYGSAAPGGETWKTRLLAEVENELDMRRVHFVGRVPHETYLDMLSISKVHAYWTTPFVLSWSFLEAACAGVPMVASATPPVMEFAEALKVTSLDFFDTQGFANAMVQRLAAPRKKRVVNEFQPLSLAWCIAAQKALLGVS